MFLILQGEVESAQGLTIFTFSADWKKQTGAPLRPREAVALVTDKLCVPACAAANNLVLTRLLLLCSTCH